METLNPHKKFGKGNVFTFGKKEFIISVRDRIKRKIRFQNLKQIRYKRANTWNYGLRLIFAVLFLPAVVLGLDYFLLYGEGLEESDYLEVSYTENGDDAIGHYSTTLTEEEEREMQDLFEKCKGPNWPT